MGDEVTIMFHDGKGKDDCAAVAGMDSNGDGKLPGGFGWLVPDGSCEVLTSAVGTTDWAAGDPGVNPECGAASLAALLGTVVAVPIFDDFCKNNAAGCPTFVQGDKYEVGRYAALYLTGYDLGGPQYERFDPAYRSAAPDCGTQSQADNCITGFFTTDVVDGGDLGGPNGGVFVIRLID
ncbi:MAG TPA: hypothetical protein VM262_01110 [Acidimicrobiales bacterium]|nr:hypothetical protein [Acidimicrobiales bacterium]